VVGGILLTPALILLVLPVLLEIFSRRVPPRRPPEGVHHPSPAPE